MADNYGHLLFLNQPVTPVEVRFKGRNPRKDKAQVEVDKAELMAEKAIVFRQNLNNFTKGVRQRREERTLGGTDGIPEILSIEIEFHGVFNAAAFEPYYLSKYGLSLNKYFDMNEKALFTVVNKSLARAFFIEIRKLIKSRNHDNPDYDGAIKYIKLFKFNSTDNRVRDLDYQAGDVVYLSATIQPLGESQIFGSINTLNGFLETYLLAQKIPFVYNDITDNYELTEVNTQLVSEIAKNFDNIYSINSSSYTNIKPTVFGTPARGYPFSVSVPSDDLPVIGVIDTGVSDQTPLKAVLINTNNDYCFVNTNPLIDNQGHGTAVAAFAALGTQLAGTVPSTVLANARILSIKVLDGRSGALSDSVVAKFISQAHNEHGTKIFVLTICYSTPMKSNELHSDYAFQLDSLAHSLGILIFISIGNFDQFPDTHHTYPTHFKNQDTNLFSPSESMNNMSIGSIGDNFEPPIPITLAREEFSFGSLPAGYTRTYHIDYKGLKKPNGKLFKPDVVFGGGNYTKKPHSMLGTALDDIDDSALQCLSNDPSVSFERSVGTSYSTPLVANIAAKVLGKFPSLRMQTIKALIINSSEPVDLGTHSTQLKGHHKRYVTGNGVPSESKSLYSTDDEATIIIESSIKPGKITAIPIYLPAHLKASKRKQSVLVIEATLCYSFKPVSKNQMAYCPVNISFGIMKNLPLDQRVPFIKDNGKKSSKSTGINGNSKKEISISSVFGWSQDSFYKTNILSNTQKVSFTVNRDKILAEDGQFQIAINSQFHKLLPDYVTDVTQ
jgi:Subtilase family